MELHELEQRAARLEELPELLSLPQTELFLGLRFLYGEYRRGTVPREQAAREKKRLLNQYTHCEKRQQDYVSEFRQKQENSKLCGELLFELNHALKEEPQDREKLLRLIARLTDRWSGMTHYEKTLFREG